MKKICMKYIFIVLALLLSTKIVSAQNYWEIIPDAPISVSPMAVDTRNGNLYAISGYSGVGDVYLYNGTIWDQRGAVGVNPVTSIAIAPDGDIYLSYRNLYKSTDNGNTWTEVFNINSDYNQITSILITGSESNYNIYFGVDRAGVYIPDNIGSWIPINLGVSSVNSIAFSADGNTLYAGTYNGVYQSTDGGNNWTGPLNGTEMISVANLAIVDNNTMFATTSSNGVFKSTDGGESWARVSSFSSNYTSKIIYNSTTKHIFVNDTYNLVLYRSTDLGESWENFHAGISGIIMCFAFDAKTGQTYVGTTNGVFRSLMPMLQTTPQSGNTLVFGDVPINSSNTQNIIIENIGSADLVITGVEFTGGGGFTLPNSENTSTSIQSPITVARGERDTIKVQFSPTAQQSYTGSITLTHNASNSPSSISFNGRGVVAPSIAITPNPLDFGEVIINSSITQNITIENNGSADLVISQVAISEDWFTGFTLSEVTTPIIITTGKSHNITVQFLPSVIGTYNGNIELQHNAAGGLSAITLTGTGIPQPAPAITTDPATSLRFGEVMVGRDKDMPVVITNIGNATLNISRLEITGTNQSSFILIGTTTDITVAQSESHTVTVKFTPDGIGEKSATLKIISDASITADTLALIGTGTPLISVEELKEIPTTYSLMQNSPNPFNPTTKIQYSLPETSNVKLSVYNSMGQKVMQLVNENQSAGKYIVDFNAQNLQSGVYFYRLQTNKFVDTKKMLLIK